MKFTIFFSIFLIKNTLALIDESIGRECQDQHGNNGICLETCTFLNSESFPVKHCNNVTKSQCCFFAYSTPEPTTTTTISRSTSTTPPEKTTIQEPSTTVSPSRGRIIPRTTRYSTSSSTTSSPTSTLSEESLPSLDISKKRRSLQKCEEYQKYSKVCRSVGLLTSAAGNTECVDDCPHGQELIFHIHNGVNAIQGEFAHAAALGYRVRKRTFEFICGGSLISEKFILTAAHCKTLEKPPVIARLGTIDVSDKTENDDLDHYIKNFFSHPEYVNGQRNDIAIIELYDPVNFTSSLRPACLWQGSQPDQNTAIAIGWGRLEDYGALSDILQKVQINISERQKCKSLVDAFNETLHICGSGSGDTCTGDSGGPLEITLEGSPCMHHIIGVTNFGKTCEHNFGAIYANVSSYLTWIEDIVWPRHT